MEFYEYKHISRRTCDGVIRLWDIRKQDSYIAELYGHNDYSITTSMEWNNNDLFTGSKDGNIIHWDLSNISKDSQWKKMIIPSYQYLVD